MVHVARQPTGTMAVQTPGAARHAKCLTVEARVAMAQSKTDVVAYWTTRKRRVCVEPRCKTPLPIDAPARIARCAACRKAQAAKDKARRARRKAAGLCITCPKSKMRRVRKGGRCEACRKKIRKATVANKGRNATREARERENRCIGCGGPRLGEVYKRCQGCRDMDTEKARLRREKRAARGRCRCGRKAVRGFKRCRKCRAMLRAAAAERKEEAGDGAE